ncbi:MAG: CsgG/HfaB family protein, partial [bacterium]|nr:CsgG/HfaB family protein [bacterium]
SLAFSSSSQEPQGHKARVAVAQFGATDRFAAVYGGWNIGGGLAAQLVTALIDTRRMVVVERATLSKVLMEQELGQAGMASQFTNTPTGQLLGVDYMIVGEVTEFEEREMGGGGSVAVLKGFGPKVSGEAIAAYVGMDIRLVDTRTGEILLSHQSKGRAWEKAVGTKIDYKVIDFGGDLFHKTPLGRATRRAIEDAVEVIAQTLQQRTKDLNWLARVIDTDGSYLYFDAGENEKIRPGDSFRVTTIQKVLTDPETNELIGLVEEENGLARAVEVALKYTKAEFIGGKRPAVGALIRFAGEQPARDSASVSMAEGGYDVME